MLLGRAIDAQNELDEDGLLRDLHEADEDARLAAEATSRGDLRQADEDLAAGRTQVFGDLPRGEFDDWPR